MRQPAVSRSSRWASAGFRGRPKRSASKSSSRLAPPLGPRCTATPAGLSRTSVAVEQPRSCFFGRHGDIGYREEPRPQRAGEKDDVLSEDAEKTAKPSLMRRWFGGRGAAPPQPAAPEQAP